MNSLHKYQIAQRMSSLPRFPASAAVEVGTLSNVKDGRGVRTVHIVRGIGDVFRVKESLSRRTEKIYQGA